jgi:hypothetical protein
VKDEFGLLFGMPSGFADEPIERPPQDLLNREWFLLHGADALRGSKEVAIDFGSPSHSPVSLTAGPCLGRHWK